MPVETHFDPDGPQPRAYFTGRAEISVHKDVAYLFDEESTNRMSDDDYFEAVQGS